MKTDDIETLFALLRFTPGRRIHSARRIKATATKLGLHTIPPLCEAIIAADMAQLGVVRRFRSQQARQTKATWPAEILTQDLLVDRLVVELRDLLKALGVRTTSERGMAARELLDEHFSQGVPYYTLVPIEDESERVGELVGALAKKAQLVKTATVDEEVGQLTVAHARYAELIEAATKPAQIEFSTVKASDLVNQRQLLELVAEILSATRPLGEEARREARSALFAEIGRHDQEISELMKARRRIKDVDPETGVPEEDEAPQS